jgi:hypothetical protein
MPPSAAACECVWTGPLAKALLLGARRRCHTPHRRAPWHQALLTPVFGRLGVVRRCWASDSASGDAPWIAFNLPAQHMLRGVQLLLPDYVTREPDDWGLGWGQLTRDVRV